MKFGVRVTVRVRLRVKTRGRGQGPPFFENALLVLGLRVSVRGLGLGLK